jgi:hypothetical protein
MDHISSNLFSHHHCEARFMLEIETIEIQNMWLEEKYYENINSIYPKLEGLRDPRKWKWMKSWCGILSGGLWIMFDDLTEVKPGPPIWGGLGLTSTRPWPLKNPHCLEFILTFC